MRKLHSSTQSISPVFYLILILAYIPFATRFGIHLIHEDALDFPSFYYGTQLTYKENKSPYDPQEWELIQKKFSSEENAVFPFFSPPPGLLIFSPLALLNYDSARVSMLILNHILIFLFIYIMLFKILEEKGDSIFSGFFIIYLFTYSPLGITIDYGQINLIIAVLVCMVWYFTKQRFSPIAIAIPLSLAILLKLYPALLVIPLIIQKKYKSILWTIIILLISAIISYFILPPTTWPDWFASVLSSGYNSKVLGLSTTNPANQSIAGLLLRTFNGHGTRFAPILIPRPHIANTLPFLFSGGVVLFSSVISYLGYKHHKQNQIDIQFSFWILATFMVAPISWSHHLVMVLPAIYVLVKYCLDWKPSNPLSIVVFATAIFLNYNYPINHPSFREGYKTLLISGQLYTIALLWLVTLILLLKKIESKA